MEHYQCRRASILGLLWLILAAIGCNPQASKSDSSQPEARPVEDRVTIAVAAASDLRFAFEDIVRGLRNKYPNIEIKTTYGSSGNFYSQINNDAPFDLFLSANTDFPARLIADGKGVEDSLFHYGNGLLAIWVLDSSGIEIDGKELEFLSSPRIVKIAIANPKHAPYGIAAVEALKSSGLFAGLESKLVLGDSVSQAAQFVESGAADIGLIAHSLATSEAMTKKGRSVLVSEKLYKPLKQSGVTIASSKHPKEVALVREFLQSDDGQKILGNYGLSRRD